MGFGTILLVGTAWLALPSHVAGTTVLEMNDSVTLVLSNTSNLSHVTFESDPSESYDSAVGLYRAEYIETADEYNYTIYLATDRPRWAVLQTCSHELDHYRFQDAELSMDEQHERIEKRYAPFTVAGVETRPFWKWHWGCVALLPRL